MSVIPVKLVVKKKKIVEPLERYYFSWASLQGGKFYEADNGTIVFMGHAEYSSANPLNIENGVGGYGVTVRYRSLNIINIEITEQEL